MSRTAIAVLAASLLLAAACRRSAPEVTPPPNPDAQFQAFASRFFDQYFAFYPSSGTAAGLHQYDTQLEDYSSARIRGRITQLRQQAAELAALRSQTLSADNSIDAVLLDNQIKAELLEHEVVRSWRNNPMLYAGLPGQAVDLLMKRSFAPAPDRLRRVTARLNRIPALLEDLKANVTEPPKEFNDLALRMMRGSVGFFREAVAGWARQAAGADSALLAEFEKENAAVLTALERSVEYLEKELGPVATGRYAIGSDTYAKKLLYEEMVDTPLPKLLEMGQATLERDSKAFIETARQMNPRAAPAEVMRAIASEYPSEDKLLEFASATAENIRNFVVDRKILPIPSEVRPTIQYTPPYARSGGFASMDTPGPFETTAREAFYYITPPEAGWSRAAKEEHLRLFNRPVMDLITIHEAYPGHYVQFLYSREFPTQLRKLTSCGTNVEGWAHYAEQMMLEQGFGQGDLKIKLAQLSEALVRDARWVAGIQLHTQSRTVEQAARLFVEKAFMEPSTAYEEARRGAYNPTYLYYTLGKLQIYKLRSDYQRAKGSAYSLARFHQDFIRQGPLPLKLIRQILLPGDQGALL